MNGAAVVALLVPDHSTEVSARAVDKPGAATGLELQIGMAVSDAVFALSQAIQDYQCRSIMAPETREIGGSKLAALVELQLGHELGDADFAAKARAQGMRELVRRTGPQPVAVNAILDSLVSDVLNLASLVAHDERLLRTAWAN